MHVQLHIGYFRLPNSLVVLLLPLLASCGGDGLTLPGDEQADRQVVQLIAVSGDEQRGTAGSRLNDPLVVEARGRTGQPIPDASVSFSFKGNFGGGALNPGTVATGADGRAAAEVTLGQSSGIQAVEASTAPSSSGELVVRFLLTAVLPDNDDDDGDDGGRDEPRGGGGDDDDDHDDDDDDRGNRGRGGRGGGGNGNHGGHD